MYTKILAVLMALSGATVGTGAAMEFAYFGPGTNQFLSGVIGAPAGLLAVIGGALLWRRGRAAARVAAATAGALLAATVVTTALDVMGPPATLLGLIGSVPALMWGWKNSGVQGHYKHGER
ncbi:MAG: hypothetical protein ABIS29_07520 [Vicinamibacterales bacterium]